MAKMSLHRAIAEIKAIEQKLSGIHSATYVVSLPENDNQVADAKKASQSNKDSVVGYISNLAKLKAARNAANSAVQVTIAGKVMTIDEALANKAALPYKQQLIQHMQAQYNNAQNRVAQVDQQIEQKVNQQLSTMFSGTKKASEEEVKLIRDTITKSNKHIVVMADGLKEEIERMSKEVSDFTTEVDYVLSEANATNTIEVDLT